MKNRLKYPLSLFVVWHPKFEEGKKIAESLYSIFCRDIDQPLTRGLGIPVYFRSTSLIPIDSSNSTRNAIVLLVEENYMTDEAFRGYTESLIKQVDDNTRLYPVALCEQAYGIGCGLDSLQFMRYANGYINAHADFPSAMKKIKTELLHDCARLLMNVQSTYMDKTGEKIPSPVKLFLSHAKKDGEETTKRFKQFVEGETKLDVFFDTVDIADGYEFEKQIIAHIKNAALVVFHTDEYSTREWCRIEVLVAKRNKCSIVVVHDIKNGEKRAFPYMGNTPTIALREKEVETFLEIVNLTLYQVVNNLYQLELLKSFQDEFPIKGTEYISITSPPELFNYIDIFQKKQEDKHQLVVLYPEPPLGAEELKILNEIDKEIKFITPIHLPTLV
ncbi:MAG: toll/interleukin-1 receptor domain-containing protein [Chitinophagales bacterium]